MGILNTILHKILGRDKPVAAAPTQQQQTQSAGAAAAQSAGTSGQFQGASASPAQAQGTATPVDVEQVLSGMEAKAGQTLNWRQSIVDLLKLLGLDSSLTARKELAQELGYTGALDGSAEMNLWLHRQVMQKLRANGGKVPPELLVH